MRQLTWKAVPIMAVGSSSLPPLIGRKAESALVRDALTQRDHQLVTLTGPGGVGKTHLALELTFELAPEYADGAHVVPLGDLRDPAYVLPAIARAIGVRDNGSLPILERLQARLAKADALLTLDNLEQVVPAVPELARLLAACPGVVILATSRTPLRTAGELIVPVPPMPVPDPSRLPPLVELAANESVKLFVQLAQRVDPDFELTESNAAVIAGICARLEGLPLAIKLAAARLQVLAPAALLERLSEPLTMLTRGDPRLPERHRTLRNAIAWSDELLSPRGRKLLRRLAVFANGCDSAAAEAVCGDPSDDTRRSCWVLDGLAELLDHGLLNRKLNGHAPRFIMPESICEYAIEGLEAIGEAEATRRRHATYYLTLAEAAAPGILGSDQETWFERLELELENVRAALRWSLSEDPNIALRLVTALWRFWYAQGYLREGRDWLERALALPIGEKSVEWVRALNGLGVLTWTVDDLDRALELQDRAFSLAREIGDRWGMAAAKGDRAIVEFTLGGSATEAREVTEEVLSEFRALGDRYGEGLALTALGNFAQSEGDLAEATRRFEEALDIARECGDARSQALCLSNLAQTTRLTGDLDRSAAFAAEGLKLARRLGSQEDMLYSLVGIAGLAAERRQFGRAARLLGAAAAAADALGIVLQPLEQAQFDRDVSSARVALTSIAFPRAWEAGRSLPLDEAVVEALRGSAASNHLRNGYSPVGHLMHEHGLSPRELEVLRLLAAGMSDRDIAAALFISSDTATTHVKHIRRKLGVHSRAAAAAFATRHGLD